MQNVVIPFKNGNSSTEGLIELLYSDKNRRNSLQKRKFFNIYNKVKAQNAVKSRNSLQKRKFFNIKKRRCEI